MNFVFCPFLNNALAEGNVCYTLLPIWGGGGGVRVFQKVVNGEGYLPIFQISCGSLPAGVKPFRGGNPRGLC